MVLPTCGAGPGDRYRATARYVCSGYGADARQWACGRGVCPNSANSATKPGGYEVLFPQYAPGGSPHIRSAQRRQVKTRRYGVFIFGNGAERVEKGGQGSRRRAGRRNGASRKRRGWPTLSTSCPPRVFRSSRTRMPGGAVAVPPAAIPRAPRRRCAAPVRSSLPPNGRRVAALPGCRGAGRTAPVAFTVRPCLPGARPRQRPRRTGSPGQGTPRAGWCRRGGPCGLSGPPCHTQWPG